MTQPFCIVMQPLCPHCKRPRMICDADVRGCGSGNPARRRWRIGVGYADSRGRIVEGTRRGG
jgi:hypothetical protein